MQAVSFPRKDKAKRVLLEPLHAEWHARGNLYAVDVPAGFEYRPGVGLRLGSLGAVDLLGPTYSIETASAVHDYLYYRAELPRGVADAAMFCDDEDPRWVQYVAWILVRLFGWIVY